MKRCTRFDRTRSTNGAIRCVWVRSIAFRQVSNRSIQSVLGLVVIGNEVEVISARAGKVLLGLDVLQNGGNAELFAFSSEAQGFRSGGEVCPGGQKLVGKGLGAGEPVHDLAGDFIDDFVVGKFCDLQAGLSSASAPDIEQSAGPD